jgi:hypothetical protein
LRSHGLGRLPEPPELAAGPSDRVGRSFYAPEPARRDLVATVEHLGDLVNTLGPRGGVARGRAQVDMPEPGKQTSWTGAPASSSRVAQ